MKDTGKGRRQFLKKAAFAGIAGLALPDMLKGNTLTELFQPEDLFNLPMLGYGYDALEPHIDQKTMEIHHSRHHQAYVSNLNKAVKEINRDVTLEEMMKDVSSFPPAIRNNGGGHWNHTFLWKSMRPGGGGIPAGKTAEALNAAFGSFDKFKTIFQDAAMKRFGSGWAWLVKSADGKLNVDSTPNQDNPLMNVSELKGIPLLGIDVWEHAYYLKYQNKRADYISAWWNVVNWDEVAAKL